MSRVCYVQGLFCLGFDMSRVCHVWGLLCLGSVMSSVCHVKGLLCLVFVMSSVCLSRVGYGTESIPQVKTFYFYRFFRVPSEGGQRSQ